MDFYLLEQDLRLPGIAAIGGVPEGLEPLDFMRGVRQSAPAAPLVVPLMANSGDEHTDIMGSLLTVFHDDLKAAMTGFGVTNIDYFPVELKHPRRAEPSSGWWLANIIGCAECVDRARSQMRPRAGGSGLILESFHIDPARAPPVPVFRLGEKPTLLVITAALREHLREAALGGVRLRHTRVYDGF